MKKSPQTTSTVIQQATQNHEKKETMLYNGKLTNTNMLVLNY